MANSSLQGKMFKVENEAIQKFLGTNISYENMKKIKSELDNLKTSNINAFTAKGGEETLKWLNQALKKERDSIHSVKKTGMDAGRENQFKKEHEKDKDNADPTGVRIPTLHKGSVRRQIETNKITYESLDKELAGMRYLIEYMNNNKQKL